MSSKCAWSGTGVQAEHQCFPRSSGKSRIQLLVTSILVFTGCFCLCDSETREGLSGISESTNSSHENGSDKKILSHLSYTQGLGFSVPIPPPNQEAQNPQASLLLLGVLCGVHPQPILGWAAGRILHSTQASALGVESPIFRFLSHL